MTIEKYREKLLKAIEYCSHDAEGGHLEIDELNETLLFELGYIDEELKEKLEDCPRWYA